ncbi:MAG: hypothetical protein ACYC09_12575 [Bacteroidota bacterium]
MKNAVVVILFCSTLIGIGSCNESLPVYTPPENVLSIEINPLNAETDSVRYSMLDNNNPNLVRVTLTSPFHGYEIAIVNNYEETIQDDLEIEGNLELSWEEKPELKAVIPITNTSFYDGDLDPVTGLVTINPGDTIRLRVYWDFRLTSSVWAFTQVQYTDGPAVVVGPMQVVSDRFHKPMLLAATIKVKILRSLSFIETAKDESIPVIFKGRISYPP